MSSTMVIHTIEELYQFLNNNGVLEIAIRQKNKRFKAFQKVVLGELSDKKEVSELTQKAANALSRITKLDERNLQLLEGMTQVGELGVILNGLNLCATCIGFAVMFKKLNDMSDELARKVDRLQSTIKRGHDTQNEFELNKVLADHTDMLDAQRRGKPYSEREMRELVDSEYNVLMLLVSTLKKDVSDERGSLIFSVFSLLSMFTASLLIFDELYYFNNRQILGDDNAWHMSHEKWMDAYETLQSRWFVETVQDYASFETHLDTLQIDVYYATLLGQVADLREEVLDNQKLIVAMGDLSLFRQFETLSNKDISDKIEAAFREAGDGLDEATVTSAYQDAMRLAAIS